MVALHVDINIAQQVLRGAAAPQKSAEMCLNGRQPLRLVRAVNQLGLGCEDFAQAVPLALVQGARESGQAVPDSAFVRECLQRHQTSTNSSGQGVFCQASASSRSK